MFNYVAAAVKALNNLTLLKIRSFFVSSEKEKRKKNVHLTVKILFIVFKMAYFIHYANFR